MPRPVGRTGAQGQPAARAIDDMQILVTQHLHDRRDWRRYQPRQHRLYAK